MATATMRRSTAGAITRERTDALAATIADHQERNRTLLDLMMRRAAGNPVDGDWDYYAACGLSSEEIERELRRCEAVHHLQQQAGTRAERATAEQSLRDAQESLRTEGAAIDAEIANLQRRKAALADAVTRSERDVYRRNDSVRRLREDSLRPKHVGLTVLAKSRAFNTMPEAVELRTKRSRMKSIAPMLTWDVDADRESMKGYFSGQRDLVAFRVMVQGDTATVASTWAAELSRLREEHARLVTEVETLEAWAVPRLAEIEALKDSLVDAIG